MVLYFHYLNIILLRKIYFDLFLNNKYFDTVQVFYEKVTFNDKNVNEFENCRTQLGIFRLFLS